MLFWFVLLKESMGRAFTDCDYFDFILISILYMIRTIGFMYLLF